MLFISAFNVHVQLVQLGRLGGWDSRDHDVFMRLWNQSNISLIEEDGQSFIPESQRRLLMTKLKLAISSQGAEEISSHIDWYLQFFVLFNIENVVE
jgi:hypothetical protein